MAERNLNTPMMKQYVQFKAQYPQALLLMRVGDFYEAYGEDAITMSRVLGMVLTKRSNGVPTSVELCGFPHHALNTYLPKLVSAGYKVAVCDQLEDPKLTKKLVKRGVTELVTPGVAYNDELLKSKENNFLASFYFSENKGGAAFLDISTGEFKVAEGELDYLEILTTDFKPKEVLVQKGFEDGFKSRFGGKFYITAMDDWAFVEDACIDKLKFVFGDKALKGFGIERLTLAQRAAGAALFYLEQNQSSTSQLKSISRLDGSNFVWLDRFTTRNLEIFYPTTPEGTSLIEVIDKTSSPMGARMLRSWIAMPLNNVAEIQKRQSGVDFFLSNPLILSDVSSRLSLVGDMERILSRAAAGKIMPREVVQLKRGLSHTEPIAAALSGGDIGGDLSGGIGEVLPALQDFVNNLSTYSSLKSLIEKCLVEDPASAFGKGDIIASGVNSELDDLRKLSREGKDYLLQLQKRESERTQIPSLKVSYNNVFGYYLEVRNTHKANVPSEWIRKQTLVNAERYITPELKEYEEKILGAEEKILALEQKIYSQVVSEIQKHISNIQLCCSVLAQLDCLCGFAVLARDNKYCKPEVNDGLSITIKQGRHPVLETRMPVGEEYVANDLFIDNSSTQIIILTGPNMAGKSALLRQTALIVLLAQCGSFVPASAAAIGVVDKIFTRVGASDNISQGESTFMVEMLETASILHNLSERSLILLDEIGRGTSTFDGMSIAWSIVEYLHDKCLKKASSNGGPKTIFATHYHELNELEKIYPRVKNYHIEVKESGKEIIFLRKLLPGGVAHSFGIHVARLAGMPGAVLDGAEKKLKELEELAANTDGSDAGESYKQTNRRGKTSLSDMQLSFFQLDDPTLSALKAKLEAADINNMTPLEAFDLIRSMKGELGL